MVRTPSSYRAVAATGTEFGVTPTKRDRAMALSLARWYCMSPDQLARIQIGHAAWEHSRAEGFTGPGGEAYRRALASVKKRLWKLSAVVENPGNHTGPLVSKALSHTGQTAWYCTPYGATAALVPWTLRSQISVNYTDHAMMAVDIGMHLESLGYTVYSERESTTGIDQHGQQITTPIASYYYTPSGGKTEKRPDLVIASNNGERFIAVEVERDRNRALSTYMEKLRAYENNPAIVAVWYVCEFPNTEDRVDSAAEAVFGDRDYPIRIIGIGPNHQGWKTIPNLTNNPTLMEDLRRLA